MGLFCSLAGMTALSIRGGTVHLLMDYGQRTTTCPIWRIAWPWNAWNGRW